MRWNDQVSRDLEDCKLNDKWKTLTQDRSEWRQKEWTAVETGLLNDSKEARENTCKTEHKHRREARQTSSDLVLLCTEGSCGFMVLNYAGLVNHQKQTHGLSSTGQCQFCHQTFKQHGLYSHECFCNQ